MKLTWVVSGVGALSVAAGIIFATSASADPSPIYNQMVQFMQKKQAEISQFRAQQLTKAQQYAASHPPVAASTLTPPPLPSKPAFTPTALGRQAWITLPWIDRQGKRYPTSVWLVNYVPYAKVGTWEPQYALSGADASGQGYINIDNIVPTGGTQTSSYSPPQPTGAIDITGVSNTSISFSTADNQTGTFDFQTQQWTISG